MKQLYLRVFGTDSRGNGTYEWTERKEAAAVYDKTQAEIDCDLLNRHAPDRVIPEGRTETRIFENFRIVEAGEGQFCIAFESRNEAERAISD